MSKSLIIKFSRYLHEDMKGLDLSLVQFRAIEAYKRILTLLGIEEADRKFGMAFTLRGPVETVLKEKHDELAEAALTKDPDKVTEVINRVMPDLFTVLVEPEDGRIFLRICKARMTAHPVSEDEEAENMATGEKIDVDIAYGPQPIEHLSNAMYRRGNTSDMEIGEA